VQVLDLFNRLRDELGVTLIVATHDPKVAQQADRILHLVDGRLVQPPDDPLSYQLQAVPVESRR